MQKSQIENDSVWIGVLLALLYFVYLFLWTATIGFNNAPDEYTHFFMVEYLQLNGRLPDANEPTNNMTGAISGGVWPVGIFWYYGLPFLHVLGGFFTYELFGGFFSGDLKYIAVRLFNIILGCIFIFLGYKISLKLTKSAGFSVVIVLVVAMLPQVSFIFSYFNSDALGVLSVTCLVYALIVFLENNSTRNAMVLGAAVGLVVQTKIYMWPAIIFALIMLICSHLMVRRISLKASFGFFLIAILISMPMMLYCLVHFGEFTGISGQRNFVEQFRSQDGFGTCYVFCKEDLVNKDNLKFWLLTSYQSYIGITGWMHIKNSNFFYLSFGLISVIFGLLLILMSIDAMLKMPSRLTMLNNVVAVVLFFGMFGGAIGASLFASQKGMPQPQGRYLFVTVPFLIYMFSLIFSYLKNRRKL